MRVRVRVRVRMRARARVRGRPTLREPGGAASKMRVCISLSGQANALRTAATAEEPRAAAWCFVDLIQS